MDRLLFTSASTPPLAGGAVLDNIAQKVGALFNAMNLKPTNITNSGNDYTLTIDPVLIADVVAGMGFYIQPNVTNTGAVRIRITAANPYYEVVKASGEAIATGEFSSDTVYHVVFFNGSFVILSTIADLTIDNTVSLFVNEFTVSGTWTKPDVPSNAIVEVEAWSGGSGGQSTSGGSGGNGGGYFRKVFKASELTATVSVSIGAGGAVNGNGGNTTFGAYMTVFGGLSSAGEPGGPFNPLSGSGQSGMWAGGYGGLVAGGSSGGNVVFGGAGGGGSNTGANAGISLLGGNGGQGGNPGTPGSVPGGGGGRNAVGAAGKVIVRVLG
jgi:hypothetical protein